MKNHNPPRAPFVPWNKGKIIGQKKPLKPKQIWEIRIRLELARKTRDLALFDLAIDSKLRGCDLVKLKVSDIASGNSIASRAQIIQQKTRQPVRFEITQQTRNTLSEWITGQCLKPDDYIFKSTESSSPHICTRHYARLVHDWVELIGLNPAEYGTHSMRRTKVKIIYRRTKNLRAIQLLLGHAKLESTVQYLGVEIDDALDISEHLDL